MCCVSKTDLSLVVYTLFICLFYLFILVYLFCMCLVLFSFFYLFLFTYFSVCSSMGGDHKSPWKRLLIYDVIINIFETDEVVNY